MDEKTKKALEAFKSKETESEIGAEIGDLRGQLSAMENTLNQLKQVAVNSTMSTPTFGTQNEWMQQSLQATSHLQQQIENFKKQTQQQLQQTQQQLQQAMHHAMNDLMQANQQFQSHQILVQMNQLIDQTQQQINHINMQGMTQQSQQNVMSQQKNQSTTSQTIQ